MTLRLSRYIHRRAMQRVQDGVAEVRQDDCRQNF